MSRIVSPINPAAAEVVFYRAGRRFHRIDDYHRLPPFFMTVVGASDLWLFIASTCGLTAGRGDAEHALFPYYTDDKITESAAHTGGLSVIRVETPAGTVSWQPFAPLRPGDPEVLRALAKDDLGTELVFTEARPDLGLGFEVSWTTSGGYGIVRRCAITDSTGAPRRLTLLDGVQNLLPAGVSSQTQNEFSVLLDAYKRAELDPSTGLATYYLNSKLTDLAEPSESLEATVAWQFGLAPSAQLLSNRQLGRFLDGLPVGTEPEVRGERGAFLTVADLQLEGGQSHEWSTVLDTPRNAAGVVALADELGDPQRLAVALHDDIERTRQELAALVAAADGDQLTGEPLAAAHHRANVLFNIMRGGVPADGGWLSGADVRRFLALRSPRTAARRSDALAALPERLTTAQLIAAAEATGDADLIRLAREYLPLTFSRRHGDPSRPWNKVAIAARDAAGRLRVDYQGNWRDILQNWEALAWSFPELVEPMIQVLLDATTADGYNPYRITRAGIDWEVPEPGNPWANIGYWSDHQIVYLCRLLETSLRFHPGRLHDLIDRSIFTHADVPYRIGAYPQIVADPVHTIDFDQARDAAIRDREAREGGDGRLLHDADGDLVRVSLAEKLLLPLAAKLVNLVPEGGIWMNTQRPEWNDANNALVGRGLSVVTLAQLRRYLVLLSELFASDAAATSVQLTPPLAELLQRLRAVLGEHADAVDAGFSDAERRTVLDALGTAGSDFRARVYAGATTDRTNLDAAELGELLALALRYADAGLHANRRSDGLFHSYNILDLADGTAAIRRLPVMLEGQVAMLSAGVLSPSDALAVLTALRSSALYRPDQHSYLLYPDRVLPRFLERNLVPADQVGALMRRLLEAGDDSVVVADAHAQVRFAAAIHNARDVTAALDVLPTQLAGTVPERTELLAAFEAVFRHAEFTGRSGSFFAYEGLGSIYWHMVSKLLLAVQENLELAVAGGAEPSVIEGLHAAYDDVRQGLGYVKSPKVYGAFPIDPYSHSPAGKGAKQPGMTGQVKEEVLTRCGELGLRVDQGRITFRPLLLRASEWIAASDTFSYRDLTGERRHVELPAVSLAFTFCQVPVVCRRLDGARPGEPAKGHSAFVTVRLADGTEVHHVDQLPADLSAEVFARSGRVAAINVELPTAE